MLSAGKDVDQLEFCSEMVKIALENDTAVFTKADHMHIL